jgi:hypothetical protein
VVHIAATDHRDEAPSKAFREQRRTGHVNLLPMIQR